MKNERMDSLVKSFDTVRSQDCGAQASSEQFLTSEPSVDNLVQVRAESADAVPGQSTGQSAIEVAKSEPETAKMFYLKCIVEQDGQVGWQDMVKNTRVFTPVLNFLIEPIRSIDIEGVELLECYFVARNGLRRKVVLSPESWASVPVFMKAMVVKEFSAWCSASDLQSIRQFIASKPMQQATGYREIGFHGDVFVGANAAINKDGLDDCSLWVPERGRASSLDTSLLGYEPISAEDKAMLAAGLFDFNSEEVVLGVLGWTAASFFKDRIMELVVVKKTGGFCVLGIEAEAGAGKTATVRAILLRLWGVVNDLRVISRETRFSLMAACSQSKSIPLPFDELKPSKMSADKLRAVSEMIRSAYNGLSGHKGRWDQSVAEFVYQAPIVLVGEAGLDEAALVDRIFKVRMCRRDSQSHTDAFSRTQELPLEKLGRTILGYRLALPADRVEELFMQEYEAVDKEITDRHRVNVAVVRFGLRVLEEILEISLCRETIDKTVKHEVFDDGADRHSVCDQIVMGMAQMSIMTADKKPLYSNGLKAGVHYAVKGRSLLFATKIAYSAYVGWAKSNIPGNETLPYSSFSKQLEKEAYFVRRVQARLTTKGDNTRCIELDIEKMLERGLELCPAWGEVLAEAV